MPLSSAVVAALRLVAKSLPLGDVTRAELIVALEPALIIAIN